MNAVPINCDRLVSDAELRRVVAAALRGAGDDRRIVGIKRQDCQYSSSFAIEEITARFADGGTKTLMCKHIDFDVLADAARAMRPAATHRPDREAFVYQKVLAGARLGTALCYGAGAVGPDGSWLLLEHVAGAPLHEIGNFDAWLEAARWLARAHNQLHSWLDQDAWAPELPPYDQERFNDWVDRAEEICRQANAEFNSDPRRAISHMVEQARRAAAQAARLPVTLIHGEFYASNVLVDLAADPPRICPIDWETAGIGCGLLDLAALIAGNWSVEERQQLADAYYHALGPRSWLAHLGDPHTALRQCRLLMAMKWIGWSPYWEAPPEHRYDWLAEALQMAGELDGSAGVPFTCNSTTAAT